VLYQFGALRMKQLITKKDIIDKRGWTIPKNTTLFIIDELFNPMTKKSELIVRVDNGTGIKKLMPKTVIEKDLVI
jgi:hypothetical protein